MSATKISKKFNTYKKLDSIISASKLKVLHNMSKVKLAAVHNYEVALLAKHTFEVAYKKYKFQSEIYDNDFKTGKNMNVLFLEEKMTLSHSSERIINAYLKNRNRNDLNIVVADFNFDKSIFGENATFLTSKELPSVSHEIIYRYVTKQYERVNVYSSLNDENKYSTILPMKELEEKEGKKTNIINSKTKFIPSIEKAIELSFVDYLNGLFRYFFINSKYEELKKTLLKHETSIEHVSEELEKLKKQMNKIRQEKLTNEILLGFRGQDD